VSRGVLAQVADLVQADSGGRKAEGEQRPPVGGAVGARRLEQAIVRVDPSSVLRVSLRFLGRMVLIGIALGVLFWIGALVTGAAGNIDSFLQQLTGFPSLTVLGFQGLLVALVLGLTFVVGGALIAVLVAVVFNLASDLGGGIKMTVMETELDEALVGRDGVPAYSENEPSGPRPLTQRRPMLGAEVTSVDDQANGVVSGALVVGVEPDSPAHAAGLAAGDVIVSVGATKVDSPASLRSAIRKADTGAAIDMGWVCPGGQYSTAIVRLDKRAGPSPLPARGGSAG
jgi:hypothetical protein